jgi:MAE_28990/MAE_18760-like HEPN
VLLDEVAAASSARLVEASLYLQFIEKSSAISGFSRELTSAKGLFFVHLYGPYEFTVASSVQRALREINRIKPRISDCHPAVLSMVLDPECRSLADVGSDKTWDRRRSLLSRACSADEVALAESLMPTNGGNPKYAQLKSIWETFSIRDPVVPRPEIRGRIEELVEHRNAIAHGREAPAAIGGRFTLKELRDRYSDVSELCTHIIRAFEGYLTGKHYLVGA